MEHYHCHPLSWLYAQVVLLVNNHLEWLQSKWSVRKIQCLSNMQNFYFNGGVHKMKLNTACQAHPSQDQALQAHGRGCYWYLRVKAEQNLWMLSNLSPFHSSHTTSTLITFFLTSPPTLSLCSSFLSTYFSGVHKAPQLLKCRCIQCYLEQNKNQRKTICSITT